MCSLRSWETCESGRTWLVRLECWLVRNICAQVQTSVCTSLRVNASCLPLFPLSCSDGKSTSSGRVSLNNSKNNFERNATDVFNLQLPNLGTIKRINIGHDNSGAGAAWHLASVEIVCMSTGEAVNFSYSGWLSRSDAPYKIEVELLPVADAGATALCRYSVVVYTSDIRGAGEHHGADGAVPAAKCSAFGLLAGFISCHELPCAY